MLLCARGGHPEAVDVSSLPGGEPQTDDEHRVAAAWAAALGRPVGRLEPFLQAGGHSLASMRLAKELGISPADVARVCVSLSLSLGALGVIFRFERARGLRVVCVCVSSCGGCCGEVFEDAVHRDSGSAFDVLAGPPRPGRCAKKRRQLQRFPWHTLQEPSAPPSCHAVGVGTGEGEQPSVCTRV